MEKDMGTSMTPKGVTEAELQGATEAGVKTKVKAAETGTGVEAGVKAKTEAGVETGTASEAEMPVSRAVSEEPMASTEKPKKSYKGLIIGLIVAAVVVIAGITTWLVLAGNRDEGTKEPETSENGSNDGDGNGGDEAEGADGEVKELALDSELVQKLYKPFKNFPGINGFGFQGFFNQATTNGANLEEMLIVQAMLATDGIEQGCGAENDELSAMGAGRCIDGKAAHAKFQEMMGYGFEDKSFDYGVCTGTDYIAETGNYFIATGCGGSGPAELLRWLYRAEQVGDKIYLYELAEVWVGITSDEELSTYRHCHFYDYCDEVTSDWDGALKIGAEYVLVDSADDGWYYAPNLIAMDFRKFADELDMIKWTFERNGAGNYVFKSVELVER